MKKFWLVCRYEYLRNVRRKRFIFALLSLPLMVLLMVGAGVLAAWANYDSRPIGFIDSTGVLGVVRQLPAESGDLFPDPVIRQFLDEVSARKALDDNQLQAYFVLGANYLKDGSVKYVTAGKAKEATESVFRRFLRLNLAAQQPPEVAERLMKGTDLEVRSLTSSRKMNEGDVFAILFPLVIGVLFLLVINTSGSYLVGALVEEKENRTMEIVVTSVSTDQLMAGKVIGNLAVGLTELLAWVFFGLATLLFLRTNLSFLGSLSVDPSYLWLSFFTMLPAFIMVAGLMATAGVTTADSREAQQIAGMFTLPIVIPFWLMQTLMESPNSPLSVFLSLFPLTSPISLPIRAAYAEVPGWQVAVSIGLLVLGAVGANWLASRAFRLGMLRYGKRLSWGEIFGKGRPA